VWQRVPTEIRGVCAIANSYPVGGEHWEWIRCIGFSIANVAERVPCSIAVGSLRHR